MAQHPQCRLFPVAVAELSPRQRAGAGDGGSVALPFQSARQSSPAVHASAPGTRRHGHRIRRAGARYAASCSTRIFAITRRAIRCRRRPISRACTGRSASAPRIRRSPPTRAFMSGSTASVSIPRIPNAPPNTFTPQIVCMRLDPWPATQPAGKIVAIDVQTGRLAIGDGFGAINSVDVSYWYGFSSSLGGGTYDRRQWLISPSAFPTPPARYPVQQNGPPGTFASVDAAISQWQADQPDDAIISILDNRSYGLPASITLANGRTLAIEAAQGVRPLLQAQTPSSALAIDVSDIGADDDQRNAVFTLSGDRARRLRSCRRRSRQAATAAFNAHSRPPARQNGNAGFEPKPSVSRRANNGDRRSHQSAAADRGRVLDPWPAQRSRDCGRHLAARLHRAGHRRRAQRPSRAPAARSRRRWSPNARPSSAACRSSRCRRARSSSRLRLRRSARSRDACASATFRPAR